MDNYFESLLKYKQLFKELFSDNQNLLKYLNYNSADPLSEPDIEDIDEVINQKIFFEHRDLSTIKHTTCLLFVKININKLFEYEQFLSTKIFFDIFIDSEIADRDSNRWIKIANEINKMINNKTSEAWIGKARLTDTISIYIDGEKMLGKRLIYETNNLNASF